MSYLHNTNRITIIGAGMAGLLAANMLRRHEITIRERKVSLPDNHSAVLRFRTTAVSDATGIPFDKVKVDKAFWDGKKICSQVSLAQANLYSYLVTGGEIHPRSIKNLEPDVRYIAPRDFVQQTSKSLNIQFGQDCGAPREDCSVISTVPMPVMMKLVNWEEVPKFNYQPIWTIRCRVTKPSSFVYQTVYNIDESEWYRATLQRDELILEFMHQPKEEDASEICNEAVERICGNGLAGTYIKVKTADHKVNHQPFGKISPIDETLRKRFILHLSDKWRIYSLGRFATWRPILLDDLVRDVKHIESMISAGCNYERRLIAH